MIDFIGEIAIGRGNHTDVGSLIARRANAAKTALLEKVQQLYLHLKRHVADFIQKKSRAVGGFQQAAPQRTGAGERAPLMAEELGLKKRLRQRATVDCNQRGCATRTL